MTADTENNDNESFAEMFEAYSKQVSASVSVGDRIKGKVIAVGKDAVFVETGTKIDGVADKSEFVDDTGDITVAQGDTVELVVVAATENEIRLSKAMSGDGGLAAIQEAYRSRVPVEGQVKEVCKGGLVVEVMKRRAFCPISQIDLKYVEDPEPYLNQTFSFIISKLEDKGRNIVVTRRQVLQAEQQKAVAAFLQKLSEGDIVDGVVTRLKPYGAFVELLPGLEAMVHISEIGWSRIEKPDDVLRPGDPIRAMVLKVSQEGPNQSPKIALSVKQMTQDPWDTAAELFRPGELVPGRVTRCMPFGAFVEIAPGVEGLAHISELSYEKRVAKPEDVVSVGQTLDVMVKEVDATRRRIALSVRDAIGDPWAEVSDRFEIGKSYEGRIEKKERFGYFISLAPGITGLLPQSTLQLGERTQLRSQLKVGDSMPVVVTAINAAARKISLEPAGGAGDKNWRQYTTQPSQSMGDLGEKLKAALATKNKSK